MSDLSERLAKLSPERRALLERQLAARASASPAAEAPRERADEGIAVIGMGCRLPGGADSPEAFWQLLVDGVDAVREIPRERWDLATSYDPDIATPGRVNSRWGGFIDHPIDALDAAFFGISPREARQMDPQQRLLLETTWEALERAGLPPARLAGSHTGVFVGIGSLSGDYYHRTLGASEVVDAYTSIGAAHCIAANRLSYLLDLRGPSRWTPPARRRSWPCTSPARACAPARARWRSPPG
jgi:acyl transferase domain-containing protein